MTEPADMADARWEGPSGIQPLLAITSDGVVDFRPLFQRQRQLMALLQEDAKADAEARVEFTGLGVGVALGQVLAQIDALARTLDQHLEWHQQSGDADRRPEIPDDEARQSD